MNIFILRHGDANTSTKVMDDFKRPISDVGVKESEYIAKMLSVFGIMFDRVFSSPLTRAKQTAEIAIKSQKVRIVEVNELKPEGNVEQIAKILSEQKENSTILLVGHSPLLVDLICYITGSVHGSVSLKTGGIAKIKTSSLRPRLSGNLEWLLTPKVIRKISK
ncbi:phosphohistidine phosphatase SixA [Candidatus Nitrosotenuis uzonensis]|nr:phosphohistidine phosphatase SixA [Candidatus Nitrosotenuis uzonensis]